MSKALVIEPVYMLSCSTCPALMLTKTAGGSLVGDDFTSTCRGKGAMLLSISGATKVRWVDSLPRYPTPNLRNHSWCQLIGSSGKLLMAGSAIFGIIPTVNIERRHCYNFATNWLAVGRSSVWPRGVWEQ